MATLYELRSNYTELLAMLYDPDVPEETVIDTLDSIEDAIEDKADGYAMIMRQIDSDIASIKAEEERLKARRIALEKQKERLKANLYEAMKTVGKTKFSTQLFSFNIRKNGGKRALILDVEPDKLPHTLRIIDYKPNNDAIREFMGTDEKCAFAHLAEHGEHLEVK